MSYNPVIWSALIILSISLSSCSKKLTPFSQRLSDNYGWTEDDLRQIQFYVSDDIVLQKLNSNGSSSIVDGKIVIDNSRDINRIIIEEGTPGVLIFSPKENRMAISFDHDDSSYLMFGPNPRVSNQYVILAAEWKRKKAIVTYGGQKYRMEGAPFTKLLVDLRKVDNTQVRSKVVKGREL